LTTVQQSVSSYNGADSVYGVEVNSLTTTESTYGATGIRVDSVSSPNANRGVRVYYVRSNGAGTGYASGVEVGEVENSCSTSGGRAMGLYSSYVHSTNGEADGIISDVVTSTNQQAFGCKIAGVTSTNNMAIGLDSRNISGSNYAYGLRTGNVRGHSGPGTGVLIDGIWADNTGSTYGLYVNDIYSDSGSSNYAIYTTSTAGKVVLKGISGMASGTSMVWNSGTGEVGYSTSTRDVKENIRYDDIGSEFIYDLLPCKYDRKDGSAKDEIGLIAEDIEMVAPDLVVKNVDGKIITYKDQRLLVPILAEVQKLRLELDEIKKQIKA
jgi:hypothetical protein